MSMVQGMTFFGSGTRPSKNPSNSSENGSFYTVPVKLSLQNRQVASKIFETLRKYKIQVTTPYHKSLRASFALVQAKVRAENPGYQVRVNLDLNKRALKAFVRPNVDHAERYPWEFVGKAIPLPPDALNPKVTEVEKIVLPTSPVLSSSISNMVTDPSPGKSPPPDGYLSTGKKTADPGLPLPSPAMKPRPGMVVVPDLGPLLVLQLLTGLILCLSLLPPLPAAMKNLPRLDSRTQIKTRTLDLIQSLFSFLSWCSLILSMNLIPPSAPQITFASINCNAPNMSEQTSLHHLIKLYGVVKLKTDVIFMSDIRLKNARGIANISKIENSFRTNPYCAYRFFHQSNSNKRGVGILV
jgi:hypothetical protein